MEEAMGLGIIINEVLGNSIKHNANDTTKIDLQLLCEDEMVTLAIVDNAQGFDTSKKHSGLGLNLIAQFSKKFKNSNYTFESSAKGTRFIFRFELDKKL
jgi:two-component sensor histidine kinase